MTLRTLSKDEDFWVIHKPTRVHFDEVLPQSERESWKTVHRLDFETSGVMVHARPDLAEETLKLFKTPGKVSKLYVCGAEHPLESHWIGRETKGWITSRYRGSKKVSFWASPPPKPNSYHSFQEVSQRVELPSLELPNCFKEQFQGELYQIQLITGARHQIRAFFAGVGSPLHGDPVYGPSAEPEGRLELHCWRIGFQHPRDAGRMLSFESLL